jgi:two-component system sensor histidine kinase AdeS
LDIEADAALPRLHVEVSGSTVAMRLFSSIAVRVGMLAWISSLIAVASGFSLHFWVTRNPTALLAAVLMAAGISAVLGVAAAFFAKRRISGPIRAISMTAARATQNRLLLAEGHGAADELADLIDNFNKLMTRMQIVDRERVIFAAGIAHELRTPLTILKGRLHGLEDGVIEASSGEAGRLLRQVDSLLRLVNDLGTLAQLHAGELSLDLRVVELEDVLRAVVSDLRAMESARGVEFIEHYRPAKVQGDPVRLGQIFMNLLTNAIKHAPANHPVEVSIDISGDRVVTAVADEGPGVDPTDVRSIFAPFWRAQTSRQAGTPGIGMGLALAARLAEVHGGEITAENRKGRAGAVFSVSLPLALQRRGEDISAPGQKA